MALPTVSCSLPKLNKLLNCRDGYMDDICELWEVALGHGCFRLVGTSWMTAHMILILFYCGMLSLF